MREAIGEGFFKAFSKKKVSGGPCIMFVFWLSREFYSDFIFVCVLCTHCRLYVRILIYPFFSHPCFDVDLLITSSMY